MENNAGSKRQRQRVSKIRLSPMDLLSLVREPLLVPAGTADSIARDFARARRVLDRLHRLTAKSGIVLAPQRIQVPDLSKKLNALERKLREFPTRRRLLSVKEFAVYADALRQMQRCVAGLATQSRRYQQRARQERYLARVGRLFLDAPPEVLEQFILHRANRTGSNIYAAALARIRNGQLPREKLAEWGRKGAMARWEQRKGITISGESISSLAGSSVDAD